MSVDDADSELVHIAVPAAYVPHVAALLAELDGWGGEARPAPRQPRPRPPEAVEWPTPELSRFARGRSKSHDTVLRMLDLLATRPGEWFSAEEVCAAIAVPRHRLGGALAGVSRMLRSHPAYRDLGLPLNRYVPSSLDGETGTFYWVSPEQARRWRQVRGDRGSTPPRPG
ncbi:hypothetical protein E1091_00765 [Micromonospora fluostatini]|uniref:Uncharacterized protein n=2 Tax=Micromonospora TaxID=1873 RepID=A0A136PUP4_9ACTN|nr:hypothetical protein [Micromonospora rosaria]KXK62221.1 hypothetical protein AWW66_09290 [Micromonospora rosaria]TDC02451.1 hypothetical protein E1091_00765 [Micromonospora fluostatini]